MASKTGPIAFLKQVREETAKVVWPGRREVVLSSFFVLVMTGVVSVFLFLADRVMEFGIWKFLSAIEHFFG